MLLRNTQEGTDSSSGSSIVFEHSGQPEAKENQVTLESFSVKPSTSKDEVDRAVCPKNKRDPQNFVPCVFLGKPRTTVNKCPAATWDNSAISEDGLSQNRLEFNNNSYIDVESPVVSEKQTNEVWGSITLDCNKFTCIYLAWKITCFAKWHNHKKLCRIIYIYKTLKMVLSDVCRFSST